MITFSLMELSLSIRKWGKGCKHVDFSCCHHKVTKRNEMLQSNRRSEPPCHPSTLQINSSGLKTPVGSRNVVSVCFCKPQLRWNETFLHVAGLISHFMLWRRRAYGLVGLRHKNYLVRVWKRSSGSQRLPKKCQSLFWQLCHLTLPPSSSIPQ